MIVRTEQQIEWSDEADDYVEVEGYQTDGCACCSDFVAKSDAEAVLKHLRQMKAIMITAMTEIGIDFDEL